MKFEFTFYKYNNITPINISNKSLKKEIIIKDKFDKIKKCEDFCKKGGYRFFGFVIYNNYVYYIKLDFFKGIESLRYHDNVILYIYTNQEIDIKTEKERLNFYIFGFKKYFEKYDKMNKKYDILLHFNRGKYNSNLNNRSWEFTVKYRVIKKENISNLLYKLGKNRWITRHYENMLFYLNCRNNRKNMKFRMSPYDMSKSFSIPTFVKSRPIKDRRLSILIPLEKLYLPHNRLYEINKDIEFNSKSDTIVWRGCDSGIFKSNLINPHRGSRKLLVSKYCFCNDKRINIGLSKIKYNTDNDLGKICRKYVKGFLSIKSQLRSKFIICVEGNDFPTNLLWVFLSNSVPVMPKPFIETWFMESNLVPWKHYVPVENNFNDLKKKFEYCLEKKSLCKSIAINSKLYALQFLNIKRENNLIQNVIDYYNKHVI